MSSDRLFEDLEASFVSLSGDKPTEQDELRQILSATRVQIVSPASTFWIEPILVAKDFIVGRFESRLIVIPFGGCAAIRVQSNSRKAVVAQLTKVSLNHWIENLPPVKFKTLSLYGEIHCERIHLDRRTSRLTVSENSDGSSWSLPISSIGFIEVLSHSATFVDN